MSDAIIEHWPLILAASAIGFVCGAAIFGHMQYYHGRYDAYQECIAELKRGRP